MPEYCKFNCMCCNRIVEGDVDENPLVIHIQGVGVEQIISLGLLDSPVYNGLIFRATGNFGSTVFDPMPIGIEEILQVVICDDCMKKKAKRVTRIHNIQREITAERGEFVSE